jgi:uncharacterized protein YciI
MKSVMIYRAVEDFLPLARENGAAHVARLHKFRDRGELLMVGTFDEPMNGDAMGIFTSREAAEEFIAGDPFVVNGVVASWMSAPGTRCSSRGPDRFIHPRTTGHDAAAPVPQGTCMARLVVSGRPCAMAGPRCITSARSEQCPKEQ